jgi:inner membrane protein
MDTMKLFQDAVLRKIPIYFKMGALLFLILILLIPIGIIDDLVGERQMRQHTVRAEISEIWGRAQSVFGPVLILPYRLPVKTEDSDGNVTMTHTEGRAFILPERLEVEAAIAPEVRYRGIFEAVVYKSDLELSGHFAYPDFAGMGLVDAEILWDRALLAAGISDLRGTGNDLRVRLGKMHADFVPGATSPDIGSGIHAAVRQAFRTVWKEDEILPFAYALDLAGSERLSFTPSAKETMVTLKSTWPHPRFDGAWLPISRSVGANGFEAQWEISWFGRDFPQEWTESDNTGNLSHRIGQSRFGASLITPVDFYLKSERSVKYALLFILLIFASVFILEVVVPVRVHLIQYALVGFAMTIFYLLLLALAEVMGFAAGFTLAALASAAMVTLYLGRAMRSIGRGVQLAAVQAGIYGFLYIVLQLEDYALLAGAVGQVAALAAVMYASRDIDWYGIGRAPENGSDEAPATKNALD